MDFEKANYKPHFYLQVMDGNSIRLNSYIEIYDDRSGILLFYNNKKFLMKDK